MRKQVEDIRRRGNGSIDIEAYCREAVVFRKETRNDFAGSACVPANLSRFKSRKANHRNQ